MFDDEGNRRRAILVQADAVRILFGVAGFVQQLVCRIRVVLDPGIRRLLVVLRQQLQRAVLARREQPVVDQLVDLVAVDRRRDGLAHLEVIEELVQQLVLGAEVELHRDVAGADAQERLVVPLGLGALVERQVADFMWRYCMSISPFVTHKLSTSGDSNRRCVTLSIYGSCCPCSSTAKKSGLRSMRNCSLERRALHHARHRVKADPGWHTTAEA